MNNEERDKMIIEMHQDIKWLKEWSISHRNEHAKYNYYFIITAIGVIIAFII